MRRPLVASTALVLAMAATSRPPSAHACGGCFAPSATLDANIELAPSPVATPIAGTLRAGNEINRPGDDGDGGGCVVQQRARAHALFLALVLASLAWLWRPGRRRQREIS